MAKSVFSRAYTRFRELLIQARKDAELTQSELAAHLARPQSYVSKYENGERRLDLIEFLQIARLLRLDVSSVISILQDDVAREQDEGK